MRLPPAEVTSSANQDRLDMTMTANITAPAVISDINSNGSSRIYRRETLATLPPTKSGSLRYSRSQAKRIFKRFPDVQIVEYVRGGRKLDSQILVRGANCAPRGCYVIISSTGGKWGKSRQDYSPVSR